MSGIVKGVVVGLVLCIVGVFVFLMLLGGSTYLAATVAEKQLSGAMIAGIEKGDGPDALKELAKENSRRMSHALVWGEFEKAGSDVPDAQRRKFAEQRRAAEARRIDYAAEREHAREMRAMERFAEGESDVITE